MRDAPASRTARAVLRHSHAGAWERCRFIHFELYTYDPVKNKINRNKHRIDLAEAETVLYDDRAITVEDRNHAEQRFVTLGMDGIGRLLVVVYHYRSEDEIRIISARLAEPREQRAYQEV